MKALAALALAIYLAAWWLTFWLWLRKHDFIRALAFIPAALCSVAVPMTISDILQSTPTIAIVIWFALPIVLVTVMLLRMKHRPEPPAAADPAGRGAAEP